MEIIFAFALPDGFSTNKMYSVARGRKIISPDYKRWIQSCVPYVNAQKHKQIHKDLFPLKHGYEMIIFMPKMNRRIKDTSNFIKSAEDLMVRCAVIMDDRYFEGTRSKWLEKIDWNELIRKGKYDEFAKALVLICKAEKTELNIIEEFLDIQYSPELGKAPRKYSRKTPIEQMIKECLEVERLTREKDCLEIDRIEKNDEEDTQPVALLPHTLT